MRATLSPLSVRFAVHPNDRRDRQLAAFVKIATTLAETDRLDEILERLAAEVREAVALESCAITLVDADGYVRTAGTAGLPSDYAALLEECRQLGAPLVTLQALQLGRVVVDVWWRNTMLDDARWQPLHDLVRNFHLGILIAAPLQARDPGDGGYAVRGALTGFRREGLEPDDEDLRFLSAMAEHAAIAISNARMFGRLKGVAAREERRKLGRDLHDSVTQELFSLSLRTKALQRTAEQGPVDDLAAQLGGIHEQVKAALAEMRAVIVHRRGPDIGDEGLVPALRRRVSTLAGRERVDIVVSSSEELFDLPEEVEEDLFMLTIEATNNALKHARGASIQIMLMRAGAEGRTLVIEVLDDGVGFAPGPPKAGAVGLETMRERAALHGGRLAVGLRSELAPNAAGSYVRAEFPGLLASPRPRVDRSTENESGR
ncbi:MAG: domain S-box [Subtercola sp.]|nr:domain S-box [Subtercola sp.]